MVCLDMKTILILRSVLNYSDVGWSYYTRIPITNYTRIPITILQEMEWPGNSEYAYEGDKPEYDYVRMYETLMIDRRIKTLDYYDPDQFEMHKRATSIMIEKNLELLRNDDVILF